MKNTLDKITKISLYLLVFLLPLWFLPWTSNVLDFNKQALLVFLVFLSLFSWLLKSLIEGKISLNVSRFNIPVIIFLLISGIGTFVSTYRYASFWGWPLNITSSFLTTLSFALLYFLLVNIFQKREVFWLLFLLVLSSFLVALFGSLQLFGKFLLPFDFARLASFNTIGTVNSLGIFLAALLPLVLTFFFISKRFIRFLLGIFTLLVLGTLFIVNFWVAWLLLLIGSTVVLVFGISRRENFKSSWLTLPMVFLVVAIFFGVVRLGIPGLPTTPLEISPSQRTSFNIVRRALKEKPLLGSGPGTFVYNYSKFKPETINQTVFWSVRFSAGASDILDKLVSTGILGFVSFLGILGVFLALALKGLIKRKKKKKQKEKSVPIKSVPKKTQLYDWILSLGIFASWLSIMGGMFLYPANICLRFLFWVLSSCFIILIDSRMKSWVLETSSVTSTLISFLFILILIMGLGLFFMEGQRYVAEIRYQQGIRAWQRGDNTEATRYLSSAISHTGGAQDNYWQALSQIYLAMIREQLEKEASPEVISQAITPLVQNSINSAKTATDAAPQNVANWIVRGFVYRQLINVIEGVDKWAITSYKQALLLEPVNPHIHTELGRVYLTKGEIEKSKEQFQRALELKSDYSPARFQIANIYVIEDKIEEAIKEMEDVKRENPLDIGVSFQLGFLYYSDEKFEKAKAEFERAISLNINYSNARYFLGLIYDKEGKKMEATLQFERIAKLNPDNAEVPKILANLKAGRPALEGITPAQPPIEEKPEEVLEK